MNPNEPLSLNPWRTLSRGRYPISLRDLWNQFISPRSNPPNCPLGPFDEESDGVPDLIQPIEGWRVWKILIVPSPHEGLPILRSVVLDTAWTPRREVAAEHSFDLGAKCQGLVKSSCSCGVYAFKGPEEAFRYLLGVRDRLLGMAVDTALGTVSLWGKVVECERGYRAQYAYPRHIYLPATAYHRIADVRSAFGVPVGVHASLRKEGISTAESREKYDEWCRTLHMKKLRVLQIKDCPDKIGFYDQQALVSRPSLAL